jgi:hypothetical protein
MALTPEQEARYALDTNLDPAGLSADARVTYDRLAAQQAASRQQASSQPQPPRRSAGNAGVPRTASAAAAAAVALSARQVRGLFLGAAGVVLFIIWIVLNGQTVDGMSAQGLNNICNSTLGQLGQGFDSTAAADCSKASTLATWQTVCFWLGLVMILFGLGQVFGKRRVRSYVRYVNAPAQSAATPKRDNSPGS